jgi:hypothetical protein
MEWTSFLTIAVLLVGATVFLGLLTDARRTTADRLAEDPSRRASGRSRQSDPRSSG